MTRRIVHGFLRIGVLGFALVASSSWSLHAAIFSTKEAKDLVAQKQWSDAMIAAGSLVFTNTSFELSGRPVRYLEPYLPPFSGISTNTVLFKADLENHSSKRMGGVVLEIVLTDVRSKQAILRKNIFIAVNVPPEGEQRLSRVYVDWEIDKAIFAAHPRWDFRLRFISQEPFLPPKPPESWFGPGDALARLRPIDDWDRFAELTYPERSR